MSMFGCKHRWGKPWRDGERHYSLPWDTHQGCTVCGAERLYNWKRMQSGPVLTNEQVFMARALYVLAQEVSHEGRLTATNPTDLVLTSAGDSKKAARSLYPRYDF